MGTRRQALGTEMFTGIIEHAGRIVRISPSGGGARLVVDLGPVSEGVKRGDSISISGACLTVTETAGAQASFDAVAETLRRTTLGAKRAGDPVNLERSLRMGGRLHGHIVQGHVDGVAEVARVEKSDRAWEAYFTCAGELTDEMVAKGSAAVDGVSLTLAGVGEGSFHVALIPETLEITTLSGLAPGRKVNVETDVLGKYVIKLLRRMFPGAAGSPPDTSKFTREFLSEHGFA